MNKFLFPDIWKLLKTEKYSDVIEFATPLLNSDSKAEVREANKLLGMAYFKQAKYQESVPYFESAADNSKDANDWFNVVTSSTLAGQIKKGTVAFKKALEIQFESDFQQQPSVPFMRYYYACALCDAGQYKLALNQTNELRSIYEQLKITDDHFLIIRGVPYLSRTIGVALEIFKELDSEFDAKVWLEEFSSNLDEEGQAYLAEIKMKL